MSSGKNDSLCFTLGWIYICTERYTVLIDILLRDVEHLLEAFPGRTQEEQVIRVTITASIVISNDASASRGLEELKEVVHIKAKENWRNHCALADTISYRKVSREASFPSNICCLCSIDAHEESDDDKRNLSIYELLEELTMFNCVKSLSTIKETSIDSAAAPEILVYGFKNHPRTQRGVAQLLEPKLEVIIFQ